MMFLVLRLSMLNICLPHKHSCSLLSESSKRCVATSLIFIDDWLLFQSFSRSLRPSFHTLDEQRSICCSRAWSFSQVSSRVRGNLFLNLYDYLLDDSIFRGHFPPMNLDNILNIISKSLGIKVTSSKRKVAAILFDLQGICCFADGIHVAIRFETRVMPKASSGTIPRRGNGFALCVKILRIHELMVLKIKYGARSIVCSRLKVGPTS
ncbi:hypothetical protein ACFE04_017694 [Oxalis oulophora]